MFITYALPPKHQTPKKNPTPILQAQNTYIKKNNQQSFQYIHESPQHLHKNYFSGSIEKEVNKKFMTDFKDISLSNRNDESKESPKLVKKLEKKQLTLSERSGKYYQNLACFAKSMKNIHVARKASKPSLSFENNFTQPINIQIHAPLNQNQNRNKNQFIQTRKKFEQNKLIPKMVESFATTIDSQKITKQKEEIKKNDAFPNLTIYESKLGIDSFIEEYPLENLQKNKIKILKFLDSNSVRTEYLGLDLKLNFLFCIKSYKICCKNLVVNQLDTYNHIKQHANILTFYQCFSNVSQIIILCQNYEQSFSHYKKKEISFIKLLEYLKQIYEGMKYLSKNKILHSTDLQNVVLINDICKLSNFEFAQFKFNLSMEEIKRYYQGKLFKIICDIAEIYRSKDKLGKDMYKSHRYHDNDEIKLVNLLKKLKNQEQNFEDQLYF